VWRGGRKKGPGKKGGTNYRRPGRTALASQRQALLCVLTKYPLSDPFFFAQESNDLLPTGAGGYPAVQINKGVEERWDN
jgi:hypothetical protein